MSNDENKIDKLAIERVGLYGGSFDPIHNGHLILAREAMTTFSLSKIIFIPTGLSPHKLDHTYAPADLRARMIERAIYHYNGFELSEFELYRSGPSFTIDTIIHYTEIMPHAQFYYLIGSDNLLKLHTWKNIEKLCELVSFIILIRSGKNSELTSELRTIAHSNCISRATCPSLSTLFPLLPRKFCGHIIDRKIDISSTEIRKKIQLKQPIDALVPVEVEGIIARYELY